MSPGPLPPRYPCQQVPLNTKKPTPQQWEAWKTGGTKEARQLGPTWIGRQRGKRALGPGGRAYQRPKTRQLAASVAGGKPGAPCFLSPCCRQSTQWRAMEIAAAGLPAWLAGWLAGCQPGSKVSCALRCDAPLRADSRGCRLPPCKLNLPKQNLLQRASRDAR